MKPQPDARTRIARKEGLIVESLSGETVMLDPDGDRYLRLNPTGAILWEALSEPRTVAELSAELASRTGVNRERAAADAAAFAGDLLDLGAVREI